MTIWELEKALLDPVDHSMQQHDPGMWVDTLQKLHTTVIPFVRCQDTFKHLWQGQAQASLAHVSMGDIKAFGSFYHLVPV